MNLQKVKCFAFAQPHNSTRSSSSSSTTSIKCTQLTKSRSRERRSNYLPLRMKARVDNPIHVQIQIIELHAIRVRPSHIDGIYDAILILPRLFLYHIGNRQRVSIG
uniref:Uncharacterized protein n=1 Tax=Opuntia streptacantha TaxID=393608 RepID=A0A7C8YIY3_OPUST